MITTCDELTNAIKGSEDALKAYEKILLDASKNAKNINIPNSSFEHAYLGIKYLLNQASKGSTIKITSGKFNPDFWKMLRSELIEFMQNNGIIKLLVLNNADNELVKELRSSNPINFKVMISDKLDASLKLKLPHFVVTEDSSYRLEFNDGEMDKRLVTGVINFNDAKLARQLSAVFDEVEKVAA